MRFVQTLGIAVILAASTAQAQFIEITGTGTVNINDNVPYWTGSAFTYRILIDSTVTDPPGGSIQFQGAVLRFEIDGVNVHPDLGTVRYIQQPSRDILDLSRSLDDGYSMIFSPLLPQGYFGSGPYSLSQIPQNIGDFNSGPEFVIQNNSIGAFGVGRLNTYNVEEILVPQIIVQPEDTGLLDYRAVAVLAVTASSQGTGLAFQWRQDGVDVTDGPGVSGATTDTLTLDATGSAIGVYDCVITDSIGTVTSETATLAARPNPAPADYNEDQLFDVTDLLDFLVDWFALN